MNRVFQRDSGKENVVQAKEGFIGAGQSNCIVTGSNYGFIGSGVGNCISTGSGYYGVIGGGSFNTVSAQYGSILGGKGNKVTHKYASASGYNVTSVADCTFHANCLNACSTPGTGVHPFGTIFAYTGGGIPSGACPLYIQL